MEQQKQAMSARVEVDVRSLSASYLTLSDYKLTN